MKQRVRGEDATLDQAKRIADDFGPVFGRLSVKLSVDHGITERVLGVLVYARGTGTLSRRTWCFPSTWPGSRLALLPFAFRRRRLGDPRATRDRGFRPRRAVRGLPFFAHVTHTPTFRPTQDPIDEYDRLAVECSQTSTWKPQL